MSQDNIHAGHKKRMRQRYLDNGGFEGFSDHEMIEILLNFGNIRTNTNETAHNLLSRFGSINDVLDAGKEELMEVDGVGETCATLIRVVKDLLGIYNRKRFKDQAPEYHNNKQNSTDGNFYNYISSLFTDNTQELMYVIYVSSAGRLGKEELVGRGNSDTIIINQKNFLRSVLNSSADAVILVHNHITGIATPSNADIENTKRIQNMLTAVGVNLIDHFVVAGNECVSILKDNRYKYYK